MNILTFDIEEWYLEKILRGGNKEKFKEFDTYLNKILEKLAELGLKGTFFCVGGMADEFPDVVKKIAQQGHEIGCHSYRHTWLNKMTREETMEDTRKAVDALEQCIGKKVKSYRAPAFSIGEQNKWAFEILAECGIERDASVYPASRDFGGFSNFGHKTPVMICHEGITLKEFPVCTTHLLGKDFAYSGGGYFRFFPLWFVRREMAKSDYVMTYFHIADLTPDKNPIKSKQEYEDYYKERCTFLARHNRYMKANLGKKHAFEKMLRLVETETFVNLEQADVLIDWEKVHNIEL